MRKHVLLISIIILSCILYGCDYFGPGMSDFNYELSGNYHLYKAGEARIWMNNDNEIVEGNVTGIAWDEDFILAEQTKDDNKSYWIIDVKNNKIYGPIKEKDFNEKRKELKINTKLKLENPKKYKSLEKH